MKNEKWRISFHITLFLLSLSLSTLYYNSFQRRRRAVHRCLSFISSFCFFLSFPPHIFIHHTWYSHACCWCYCYCLRAAQFWRILYSKAKYGKWFANCTGSVSIWGNGRAFKVIKINTYYTRRFTYTERGWWWLFYCIVIIVKKRRRGFI